MTTHLLHPYPDLPLTLAETGAGRPVLVLHGGAGAASMTAIVDHFATTCRVLVPTHPGWEETPRPEWFAGVDSLASIYLDLLDDLDLRDVLVIGSSFGGWIAAELVVRDRGHRISQLVLMGAIGPEIPGQQVQLPGSGPVPAAGPSGNPEPPAAPRPGPSPAALATMLAYTGPSLRDPKLLRRLGRVKVPTLLVWGENDTVVTPDFGRAYAAAFGNARFALIPGASHIPTRDAPAATLAVIATFVAQTH